MPPKRKQPAAAPGGAKGSGAAAEASSGSEVRCLQTRGAVVRVAGVAHTIGGVQDLVSQSDDGSGDDDDDDDDDEAPQEPAPDDGEGSDFEELQARACWQPPPPLSAATQPP